MLAENHRRKLNRKTLRQIITCFGYKAISPRKKPYINKTNRLKRLEFAKKYINHPPDSWNKVLFTVESDYNIFENDGLIKVT